jgi:hypothetical protein
MAQTLNSEITHRVHAVSLSDVLKHRVLTARQGKMTNFGDFGPADPALDFRGWSLQRLVISPARGC